MGLHLWGMSYEQHECIMFMSVFAGSLHMSPGVLAGMWKEEEQKVKLLEEKMKTLLKEKGVS